MKLTYLPLVLSALVVPCAANAADRLFLQLPVQFGSGVELTEKFKAECELGRNLASETETQINKRYGPIEVANKGEPVGNEKAIQLTVTSFPQIVDGSWAGSKAMTVMAELKQGDTVLTSKSVSRNLRASTVKGNCSRLGKYTGSIAGQIGAWVKRGMPQEAPSTDTETEE